MQKREKRTTRNFYQRTARNSAPTSTCKVTRAWRQSHKSSQKRRILGPMACQPVRVRVAFIMISNRPSVTLDHRHGLITIPPIQSRWFPSETWSHYECPHRRQPSHKRRQSRFPITSPFRNGPSQQLQHAAWLYRVRRLRFKQHSSRRAWMESSTMRDRPWSTAKRRSISRCRTMWVESMSMISRNNFTHRIRQIFPHRNRQSLPCSINPINNHPSTTT